MVSVRGLRLPELLLGLMAQGRWRHPGDEVLSRVVPWFEDPVDFFTSVEAMERGNTSLEVFADDEWSREFFREVRGSTREGPVELPWLDVEQAVLIAECRFAGADVALALDYRGDASDPRVLGSDLWTDPRRCEWRVIAPTFSAFVRELGLDG